MPTVGPDFFSSGAASSTDWVSPQNIENAPDNLAAQINSFGLSTDYLYAFSWLGSVPKGFFWDFPNFVFEAYVKLTQLGSATATFKTFIILTSAGQPWGGLSSSISAVITSLYNWHTVSQTDWDFTGLGRLPTDVSVGIALACTNLSVTGAMAIDSVRLTVSYNSVDNFFNPPYAVSRNRRRFIAKRNGQRRVICEQMKPRMLRRKAA